MGKIFFALMLLAGFFLLPGQVKESENAEFFFNECKTNLENGNIDKAIENGGKAIELNPDAAEYHFYYGKACMIKSEKSPSPDKRLTAAQKAKKALETAVKLDSKNVEFRYGLGQFYYTAAPTAGGSFEKAEEQAFEVLQLHPIKGYLLFAEIQERMKDFVKAEKSMEAAYKLHLDFKTKYPSEQSGFHPDLLNRYGYRSLKGKKVEKAITFFKMNVKAFPDYFNGYDSLAEVYMIKGDKELALKYYKKALALNPNNTKFERKAYNLEIKHIKTLQEQIDEKKTTSN